VLANRKVISSGDFRGTGNTACELQRYKWLKNGQISFPDLANHRTDGKIHSSDRLIGCTCRLV